MRLAPSLPSTISLQAQYCTDWSSISWLNPMVGAASQFVRANATVCLKNGPAAEGLIAVQDEPGGLALA